MGKDKDKEEKKRLKAPKELEKPKGSRIPSIRPEPTIIGKTKKKRVHFGLSKIDPKSRLPAMHENKKTDRSACSQGSGYKESGGIQGSQHSSGITLHSGQHAPWVLNSDDSRARTPSVNLTALKSILKSQETPVSGTSKSKPASGISKNPLLSTRLSGIASSSQKPSGSQVGSQAGSQPVSQAGSRLGSQAGSREGSQMGSRVGSQIRSQVGSQVGSQAGSQARVSGMISARPSQMRTSQRPSGSQAKGIGIVTPSQIRTSQRVSASQAGPSNRILSSGGSAAPSVAGSSASNSKKNSTSSAKESSTGKAKAIEGPYAFYNLNPDQTRTILKRLLEEVNWSWFKQHLDRFKHSPLVVHQWEFQEFKRNLYECWMDVEEAHLLYFTIKRQGMGIIDLLPSPPSLPEHRIGLLLVQAMVRMSTGWNTNASQASEREIEILNAILSGEPFIKYVREWCREQTYTYMPLPGYE
ncbi:hypothetical protein BDZ45DRAFT_751725 [Acephala macrosclerotiorum]|nr:hypothetical protein BDZ45DRAFT_751725 [Acephala macrosclerotiorum]